jgi:Zn-dependent protease with chaperone function
MRFRQHERTARQSTLRLLALFALVLVGLLLAVNTVLALIYWITFPFARGFPIYFFETNCALVLLFVLGGCWVESVRLRGGGAHVARLAGGREAQVSGGGELAQLERRFANVVQEMSLASGHAGGPPAAWVLPKDDAINAFAAGWDGEDAVVAVTRGALERLTRAELQGVVAHEFSHLVHGDTRLNMRLIGLVWGLQMIWGLGVSLSEPGEDGRRGFGTLFGVGLMAVGSLGWAAGRLLQAAVSRQREFLADASAVKYTRLVDGLGGALRKIADQQMQGRAALQSAYVSSLTHLLLSSRGASGAWRAMWHTHPPLAERLRRLYGRDVLPVAAPVLDVDPGDAEPLMALAARVPATPPARGTAHKPTHLHTEPDSAGDDIPDAHRHDAMQLPSSFDAGAREQEALARIEHWHGPGEWQAAMLALALETMGDVEQDADSLQAAWVNATRDLAVAAAVQNEIRALGPNTRRQVFAILIRRANDATPAHRRVLRKALMQRWSALPASPATQWRMLAIALLLGDARRARSRGALRRSLEQQAGAAHAATLLLARALGALPDAAQSWQNAAARALVKAGAAAARGPAAGLAPSTSTRSLQLALRVRRIGPMQRPQLVRAWFRGVERSRLADHAGTGDALHLACLVLDVPPPESLLR